MMKNTMLTFISLSTGDVMLYKSINIRMKHSTLVKLILVRQEVGQFSSLEFRNLKNMSLEKLQQEYTQANSTYERISTFQVQGTLLFSHQGTNSVFSEKNGKIYTHELESNSQLYLLHKNSLSFLLHYDSNKNYVSTHLWHFPATLSTELACDIYEIHKKPIRLQAISKNNSNCLIVWCKTKQREYLELYDIGLNRQHQYKILTQNQSQDAVLQQLEKVRKHTSFKLIDFIEFNQEDSVTGIQSLFVAYSMGEFDETLALQYVTNQANGFYSKWKLIRISTETNLLTKEETAKLSVADENFEQEGNEFVTCVFCVNGNIFVCIDNRIFQFSYTSGKKMVRKYYPNMSYIIDAAVSNNSVVLCNLRGRIIFMVWSEDQKKLQQRYCYTIQNCLLRSISFLDNEQPKLVCTDSEGKAYILSLFEDEEQDDLTLQIVNVIKLGANSVDFASEVTNKGLDLALIDGGLFQLKSKKLAGEKCEQIQMETYKFVTKELPYFLGIHPKNILTLNPFDYPYIEKLAKYDLLNEESICEIQNLSLPIQQAILQSVGLNRAQLNKLFLEPGTY